MSSPGIDRPLFTLAQFARFIGEQAKVSLACRRTDVAACRGASLRVEGDSVVIDVDGKDEFAVAIDNIEKARLVPDLVGARAWSQHRRPAATRQANRRPNPSI